MSFNRITIYGRLGRDPELRRTQDGKPVCTLSVATTERVRSGPQRDQSQDVTTWFRVSAFGRQAEFAHQNFRKGNRIFLLGAYTLREWTDNEGVRHYTPSVRAIDIQFTETKAEAETSRQHRDGSGAAAAAATAGASPHGAAGGAPAPPQPVQGADGEGDVEGPEDDFFDDTDDVPF